MVRPSDRTRGHPTSQDGGRDPGRRSAMHEGPSRLSARTASQGTIRPRIDALGIGPLPEPSGRVRSSSVPRAHERAHPSRGGAAKPRDQVVSRVAERSRDRMFWDGTRWIDERTQTTTTTTPRPAAAPGLSASRCWPASRRSPWPSSSWRSSASLRSATVATTRRTCRRRRMCGSTRRHMPVRARRCMLTGWRPMPSTCSPTTAPSSPFA